MFLKPVRSKIPAKNNKCLPLAPIAVEILFIFSLKIKRLQRKAGTIPQKMPNVFAPKNNN